MVLLNGNTELTNFLTNDNYKSFQMKRNKNVIAKNKAIQMLES